MICDQCGEYILSGDITKLVLAMAEEAYKKGWVRIDKIIIMVYSRLHKTVLSVD